MIGKTVSHYKILEKIGAGGMGIVYKAQDLKLDRPVALKFLPPHLTSSEEEKQRFIHEAKAASSLDHSNVCTIHEIDETEEGQMFIVMACYDGETLKEKIKDQRLKINESIDIIIQIAHGLQKAHEKNIIHRDIKPANIIITNDSVVKIVDFGLAKLTGQTQLTKEGSTLGTIAYMSPEQARGESVEHSTDIWSLGAVLYEVLTGDSPFKGDYDQAVVYSILNEEPKAVTEINKDVFPELQTIINKCLQKDPGKRYQNIQDLITDLQYLTTESGESTVSITRDLKRMRKKTTTYALSAMFLVILAIILVFIVFPHSFETASDSERHMLVVLPFENLGSIENAYFTDGITDEITGRLGTVTGIGVISRNSAMHYAGRAWETRKVGEELNVEYIIAGTVRWAFSVGERDRVRITPRLIRVSDDTELWAESYDRVIQDIFVIQTEIAMKVVQQLGITLRQSEQQTVEAGPTDNLEAYQAFLQGRHYARSPHFTVDNWKRVIQSYQRAVELDPNFAVAYAKLASSHARLYFLRHDISKERLDSATRAAEQAETLAPDSPEVLLSLGYYYLWAHRDMEQALNKWTLAEKMIPDDPRILEAKANLFETQGRWEEAIESVEKAIQMSPKEASLPTHLAMYYWYTRRYSRALDMCNQAIALAPEENWPYLYKTFTIWSWKGVNEESRHAIEAVRPEYHWVPWAWFWQDVGERNYERALSRLSVYEKDWIRNKMWAKPKSMMQAMIYDFTGKPDSASAGYQAALLLLQTEVENWPEDPRYYSALGIVYASLGHNKEALHEGRKAVELLPISKDATYGLPYAEDLALIYLIIGDEDAALDHIEMLFTIPSWMSVNWIKMNPLYDRLNDNPRFQNLIKKYDQKLE